MGLYAAGQVVFIQFPFSDLSRAKVRPVVLLADVGKAIGSRARSPATLTSMKLRSQSTLLTSQQAAYGTSELNPPRQALYSKRVARD